MPQKKKLRTKTKLTKKNGDAENEVEIPELDDPKAKKVIDLEAALEPAAIAVDEKIIEEDAPVTTEDGEDPTAEELTLDDEELNPFGDKWEQ